MTLQVPPIQRPDRHAKCIPPAPERVPEPPVEEIVYYDLSGNVQFFKEAKVRKVYNVTQLPPPLPDISPNALKEREQKRKRVEKEEKKVAKKMERRIKDISHIYRISVPAISDSFHCRSSSISTSPDNGGRLPDIHRGGRYSEQSKHYDNSLSFPYRGSMFRATMEDRKKNSRSYEEFVGRLSYLINHSRAKMSVLYGSENHSAITEFLGKSPRNKSGSPSPSVPDNMRPFRQKQFSIGNAVRKLLDIEDRKSLTT